MLSPFVPGEALNVTAPDPHNVAPEVELGAEIEAAMSIFIDWRDALSQPLDEL